MSQIPPQTENETSLAAVMSHASSLTLGLIVLARAALARFGGAPLPRGAARLILSKFIVPAEAAVRRAILVLASTLPAPAPRTAKRPGSAPPPPPPSGQGSRPPVFSLSEPLPRPAAPKAPKQAPAQTKAQTQVWPRVSLLDFAAPGAAPAPATPAQPTDDSAAHIEQRLLRRLAALESAYDDPIAQARRYLRRRAAAAAKGAGLKPPLSFKAIPGHTRHLPEAFRPVLAAVNTAAFNTLPPAPDSS